MSSRRSRVAGATIVVALATSLFLGASSGLPAGAADPADEAAATSAAAWIVDQQEPDGGFELADFPGFETSDAVLAIASAAQTGTTWSEAEALAAIEALQYGGSGGPTPIDALDDWVTTAHAGAGVNAGEAAKLLVLVVTPLGLDPAAFGPSGTDLAAKVYPSGCGSAPALGSIFFYEKMYVGLGGEVLCGEPDATVVQLVRDAQRDDGGWNFNGSTAPADPSDPFDPNLPDVDTTAVAMEVLVAAGAAWDDPAVQGGLAYLAAQQSPTGAFRSFGADDPNATAVAMLAITAAGFDPNVACWRTTAVPETAGTAYAAPNAWLRSQQQPDGHIAGPNDAFFFSTFATSQTVEGLLRTWLPIARAGGAPTCLTVSPGDTEQDPVADPVTLVPRFTG